MDELFVVELLIQVSRLVNPKALFLHSEQAVSLPINYHFVYHNSLDGYLEDMAEIARLWLSGGEGYGDGRAGYPPASTDERGETMMFAGRSGEWLATAKRFLAAKIPRLVERGLPERLTRPFMDDALRASTDLGYYYHESGLGVYALPPLEQYCEDPYFEMIERLAG
jgi:hypothetical protein